MAFTDEERKEIQEIIKQGTYEATHEALENYTPKPTDAERKAQIMRIPNAIQRQKAISENMDLFRN